MRVFLKRVRARLSELEQRRAAIEETIAELRKLESETVANLEKAGK